MITPKCKNKKKYFFLSVAIFVFFYCFTTVQSVLAQRPTPIIISQMDESILERMERTINLKIKDMQIIDIIRHLAEKGEFNTVISPTVQGRVTVFLENVSIKDALDIAIISNHLAYIVQNNIIQVMTEQEYEAMFGRRFSDKTEVSIVHLKYSKPTYVLAALDNLKSNIGKIIIDEDTGSVVMIDTPEAIAKMKAAMTKIEKPLETFVYTLQYARADVISDKLRGRIDMKAVGSIMPDLRSNKLIVRVYPDRLKEVEQIIKKLDMPTKEVLIDARILQIVVKPEYDVGVDWQLDFRDSKDSQLQKVKFNNLFMDTEDLTSSDNLSAVGASSFGQVAVGDFSTDAFELKIRALEKVSDTKILSNPQLLVTNNEEAKIHIGDTVPYIISTTSGTGDNAITSEDVRFVDVGLKLNVTPTINDDGFVTMRLRPEISTVTAQVTSQGGGIPQVNKTELETTVLVKDGHTIIMGGLKKDDNVHTKKGLPVLMDLPLLGPMFGRTSDKITSTEIVIFITPHIFSGQSDDYTSTKGTIKPSKAYSSDR